MPEELVISLISLISLITGITSIVLAICAIAYTALNDIRNRRLNIEFTRNLTIIEEKSTSTQGSIDSMLVRLIDTLIEWRRESTPPTPPLEITTEEITPDEATELTRAQLQLALNPLLVNMAKLGQNLQEMALRQRLLPGPTIASDRFTVGQRIHVPANSNAPPNISGRAGTIVSPPVRYRDTSGTFYRHHIVSFDQGLDVGEDIYEMPPTPVREEWLEPN